MTVRRAEDAGYDRPTAYQMPERLLDYAVVLVRGKAVQEKAETVFDVQFEAQVQDRWPRQDHTDCELPLAMHEFVFPDRIRLASAPPSPIRHSFALTSATGTKQNGVCLVFYERMPAVEIAELQNELNAVAPHIVLVSSAMDIYSPKAFVLLSHWPLINTFHDTLMALYRISISQAPIPFERFLSNIMHEVPVPPMGRVRVQFALGDRMFSLSRSPPNELATPDCDMALLFQMLDLDSILHLFSCLIAEMPIVLCSKHMYALGAVAEALCSMLSPFTWTGIFMPVIPKRMLELLYAPVPYIAGIQASFLDGLDVPSDIVFVDLDQGSVRVPQGAPVPTLPERESKKLRAALHSITVPAVPHNLDHVPQTSPIPTSQFVSGSGMKLSSSKRQTTGSVSLDVKQQKRVQEAFYRFFVKLLMHYRHYLVPCPENHDDLNTEGMFDAERFVQEAPESHREVLQTLVQSQLFSQFIIERWNPQCSRTDADSFAVMLFDESILAKANRSKVNVVKQETPFLNDTSYAISDTYIAPAPNTAGIAEASFVYSPFPKLRDALFGTPRHVGSLIDEERQQRAMKPALIRHVSDVLRSKRPSIGDIRFSPSRSSVSTTEHDADVYFANYTRREFAAQVIVSTLHMVLLVRRFHATNEAAIALQPVLVSTAHSITTARTTSLIRVNQCTLRAWIQSSRMRRQIAGLVLAQASLRGCLVRRQHRAWLHNECKDTLHSVSVLYGHLNVPLLHRYHFWVQFGTLRSCIALNFFRHEHRRLSQMQHRGRASLMEAKNSFDSEYRVLYTILKKKLSRNELDAQFTSFGIGLKEKRRKEQLLKSLWRVDDEATSCGLLSLMLERSHDAHLSRNPFKTVLHQRIELSVLSVAQAALDALQR